jgi:hypothetical protein
MTYIGRLPPKYNTIFNDRMKVGEINNLKNISMYYMRKFSNGVTSCTQFGKYPFYMLPPIKVIINMQTKKFKVSQFGQDFTYIFDS